MKILWKNKKIPWNTLIFDRRKYNSNFFFYISRTPQNTWMWYPRIFLWFNLFLISYHRDNSNIRIGFGFGKTHYCLNYHH